MPLLTEWCFIRIIIPKPLHKTDAADEKVLCPVKTICVVT